MRSRSLREAFVPLFLVRETFGEAVRAGDGAGEAEFLEHRPVLGIDELDAMQPEAGGGCASSSTVIGLKHHGTTDWRMRPRFTR